MNRDLRVEFNTQKNKPVYLSGRIIPPSDYNRIDPKGRKQGLWLAFDKESHRLISSSVYIDGVENGEHALFDLQTGKAVMRGTLKNGQLEGIVYEYHRLTGALTEIFLRQNGETVPHSKIIFPHRNGIPCFSEHTP